MIEVFCNYAWNALVNAQRNGYDVILFGLGRFGLAIAQELRTRDHQVLCVDYDPDLVHTLAESGYAVRYGDAENPEFLATLPFDQVSWIVSSARDLSINLALLQGLQALGYNGQIAVTTHNARHTKQLMDAGANEVLIPYTDASEKAVNKLLGESKESNG
jgi:Trk K+ transport system NAD-binding subunit